ncbi:hypothetical protein Tco_0885041 [Tanacetum coccineum]
MVEEVGQSEEVADEADSEETKEDDEEPLNKRKTTGLVIGGEGYRESDEEGVDYSKKLKGLETLSEVAQFKLNMKKARKASKHDFFLQPRPRGSGEGSGVTLEFPNELTLKSSNEGAGVTPEVPDESSDHSSSSSSDLEFAVEDISSDEADVTEKADDAKKAGEEEHSDVHGGNEQFGDAQADVRMTEPLVEKLEATKVSSSMTLSSVEFTSQFLNDNPDVTVNDVLKDPVEPEVQSMVDVPVTQAKPAEQRPPLVYTTKSKKPDTQVDSGELESKVTRLEKKFHAMSSFNLPDPIDKSVKAHLKKVLLANVPNISLDEFDQKDKLFQMMSKSMSYNKHPAHKALYDALALSLSTDADKESKKKKRKDSDAPSSKKTKDQSTSSKKGTTPSKPLKLDKFVQAEETVEKLDHEEAMDDEEPVVNEVVNTEGHPQDDAGLSQDRSNWFKQPPIPKTPDPEWSKDPNTNVRPEQNWFDELETTEKDPVEFDDLMGSTIDFSNFIKHRLKKDKITKADLEGPVFKLLQGTCRINIELEYYLEQRPPGHLTITVEFFFNNDLEYLKNGNKERKYATSVTKTKDAMYDLKFIEDMIPKLWSLTKAAYDKDDALGIYHWGPKHQLFYRSRNAAKSPHEVFSHMQILGFVRLTIDNQFRYGYLKEIVVKRADLKEYSFGEADFSKLHLNDIEDLFLLYVQRKIHNLTGDEIVHLVNALHIFTRSIVIQRRVEDVQLGVKSYQKKLNITKLQTTCDGISFKEPYTIIHKPRGVMVYDNLHDILHNFVLSYNDAMLKRKWSEKYQQRTDEMMKLIDNLLLERRIMRSLECYVSGRLNETDYRLRAI